MLNWHSQMAQDKSWASKQNIYNTYFSDPTCLKKKLIAVKFGFESAHKNHQQQQKKRGALDTWFKMDSTCHLWVACWGITCYGGGTSHSKTSTCPQDPLIWVHILMKYQWVYCSLCVP